MAQATRLYNSKIIQTYVEYLRRYYPTIPSDTLLDYAGITRYELRDPAHWLTQDQIDRFHEILDRETQNPQISREVGRYAVSSQAFGTLKTHALGFMSPLSTYELVGRFSSYIARHVRMETRRLGRNRIEILVTPLEGVHENPCQCQNRLGNLEGLARLYTGRYARIEHTECMHRGQAVCRYLVTWESSPAVWLRRLARYLLVLGGLICAATFFLLPTGVWTLLATLTGLLTGGMWITADGLLRHDLIATIEDQASSARDLLEQNATHYSTTELLQEIAQAASSVRTEEALCVTILETLARHLGLTRSALLLRDEAGDGLICGAAYGGGVNAADLSAWRLALDATTDSNPLTRAVRGQKPSLVEDIAKFSHALDPATGELIQILGLYSLVCVPVVGERETLGILLTEGRISRRYLTLTDMSLLEGVAALIAVGLSNARAFQLIQASEERYRTIFESTANATVIVDRDLNIILANTVFSEFTGLDLRRLKGEMHLDDFIGGQDLEEIAPVLKGEACPPAVTSAEVRLKGRTEEARVMHLTASGIPGTPHAVISLLDITESKQAHEELAKSRGLYAFVMEHTADLIAMSNEQAEFVYVSPSYTTTLGYAEEELLGQPVTMLVHPDDLNEVLMIIAEHYATLSPDPMLWEYRLRHKDGHALWAETKGQILFDSQGVNVGAVFTTRDITERRFAQEERLRLEERLRQTQKMEAIGRLAGGIAHDFNNILSVIIGVTDLILTTLDPDEPLRSQIDEVNTAAQRAASLTRQLLAFSRKQVISPRVIDPNTVLTNAHKMLERIIGEDVLLDLRLDENVGNIMIDPGQLEQILINLAANARDAMPDGGRLCMQTSRVTLENETCPMRTEPVSGDFVRLSVKDTGEGMDEETLNRIFEPFFSTKEQGRGTGLGLATVYGIVEQNHAFISVESHRHRGSTFRIHFPRVDSPAADEPLTPRPLTAPPGDETILVAEDEPMVRSLVKSVLEKNGYTVLEAADGPEALCVSRGHPGEIHLLITDVIMPTMKGSELAERLQSERTGIKVLFMSGYTENIIAPQGILTQGINFIQKPFSINDLNRIVREVLDA